MSSPNPVEKAAGAVAGKVVGGALDAADAVGDAVGGATTALVAPFIAPLINAIQIWMNSIQSGFAHWANVVINNTWYGIVVLAGGITMGAGIVMLWASSPVGGAVTKVAKTAASVAVK